MMSGGVASTLLFLGLPDLKSLLSVTLSLIDEDEEVRSKQMKICRELVQLHPNLLSSPSLDSFSDITAVMAVSFFQTGIIQAFVRRRCLQLSPPRCVFPGDLQRCLSYSLITRLSPSWNKAGLYLIQGPDFLTERGRLNAVSIELNASNGQLCISIKANAVEMPPLTDLNLPPMTLQSLVADADFVVDITSCGGGMWCHVLPSMKKGQIVSIRRGLPSDGPFRNQRDLQNHWNLLYGYRIPDDPVVYCSVYFRLLGQRVFTYPLSCIRLQPVRCCPRVDLRGALSCFLNDISQRLQSVCGAPVSLSWKPCSSVVGLQMGPSEQINLTSVPTQWPLFGSQPTGWTSAFQQEKIQDVQVKGRLTLSQVGPSSSFLSVFQPASSLSSSSSQLRPALTSSAPEKPPPKLVPIFRNKNPSHHVNVALLRVRKHQQRGGGGSGVEVRKRVSLPVAFLHPHRHQSSLPAVKHLSSFTPSSQLQCRNILALKPENKFKPSFKPKHVKMSKTGSDEKKRARAELRSEV
ncbi:uncharacterized protein C18orf63 homolog isoform X2 [Gouania willdenowi]|uniref:uncharacterized protein C18orf63 homolog isoform X2 n=1 Tax=Gouania willdenowi TaxID=441366 RepID=UPI0010566B5E|nr:uncharacterized protein C18orf63 homolog isoform X2 [Gouania willdenowi]